MARAVTQFGELVGTITITVMVSHLVDYVLIDRRVNRYNYVVDLIECWFQVGKCSTSLTSEDLETSNLLCEEMFIISYCTGL